MAETKENKYGSGVLELSPEREKFLDEYWKKRREARKAERAARAQSSEERKPSAQH